MSSLNGEAYGLSFDYGRELIAVQDICAKKAIWSMSDNSHLLDDFYIWANIEPDWVTCTLFDSKIFKKILVAQDVRKYPKNSSVKAR